MRVSARIKALIAVAVAALLVAAVAHAASTSNQASTSQQEEVEPAPDATEETLPALDEPVPRGARAVAAALRDTSARLDDAVDAWREQGDLGARRPPLAVTHLATYESRIIAALAGRPTLSRAVVPRLPGPLARRAAPEIRALHDLQRLHDASQRKPGPPPKIKLGRPRPAAELMRYYRAAQRRFGVGWHVLAAVNYIESRFGRLRNESISGARGPMQFMPATWRAYGMGGNVRDPRDAIMGAANYLRANGAPHDYRRALYRYNPSSLYVRTVRLYANRIARAPSAYPALYAREVLEPRG